MAAALKRQQCLGFVQYTGKQAEFSLANKGFMLTTDYL